MTGRGCWLLVALLPTPLPTATIIPAIPIFPVSSIIQSVVDLLVGAYVHHSSDLREIRVEGEN